MIYNYFVFNGLTPNYNRYHASNQTQVKTFEELKLIYSSDGLVVLAIPAENGHPGKFSSYHLTILSLIRDIDRYTYN